MVARILQVILVLYLRQTPMFYLPSVWFQPFSWVLSFPFAPAGSVGVVCWLFVCRGMSSSLFTSFLGHS